MKARTELWAALIASLLTVVITVLPYALASQIVSPPAEFTGFLLNPIDGFSYLAKIRQGWEGNWQFLLAYSADPGPPVFLYQYFLALGHLASWLMAELIVVFHAARAIAAVGMFFLAFLIFKRILPNRRTVWFAFLTTLIGSGLGWLSTTVLGVQTSDISIPESIPFLVAYSNAHFPAAMMCILGAFLVVLSGGLRPGLRYLLGFICGLSLALVLPFSVLSLVAALLAWLVWEWLLARTRRASFFTDSDMRPRILSFLMVILGAAPIVLYDLWITQSHPIIRAWTSQNITPSPPVLHYLIGYGVLIILALVSVVRARPSDSMEGRVLLSWVITGALLLYAPMALQRRLSLGLYIPLAALASLGLDALAARRRTFWTIALVLLILTVPTNLLVIGAGLYGVGAGEGAVLHTTNELVAYRWIAENIPKGSVVLGSPETGNRLPAFASARVIYGHPFETPSAEYNENHVLELFSGELDLAEADVRFQELGVDYIFYGDRERELGEPQWLTALTLLQEFGEVAIYRVP